MGQPAVQKNNSKCSLGQCFLTFCIPLIILSKIRSPQQRKQSLSSSKKCVFIYNSARFNITLITNGRQEFTDRNKFCFIIII
jgi:hypothetical protein